MVQRMVNIPVSQSSQVGLARYLRNRMLLSFDTALIMNKCQSADCSVVVGDCKKKKKKILILLRIYLHFKLFG